MTDSTGSQLPCVNGVYSASGQFTSINLGSNHLHIEFDIWCCLHTFTVSCYFGSTKMKRKLHDSCDLFFLQMRLGALKQILALLHSGEGSFPAVLQDTYGCPLNLRHLLLSAQLQLLLGTLGPEVVRPSTQLRDSEVFLLLHYQACVHSPVLLFQNHQHCSKFSLQITVFFDFLGHYRNYNGVTFSYSTLF